ncbi:hypothetical protein [Rhizobium ruizarguesonis]|uniref:hypothetical protein n=1 Tax=Rhizobium ruizarguesonis TaxID=2081791 RepID=UPI0013E08BF7|nr:hypothetical protein [Rhizobium ruizarguesonis]NEI79081.1 hypothetical protein [Rhizobium ruizarguesonis]
MVLLKASAVTAITGFSLIARDAIAIDFEVEEQEDFTTLQRVMRATTPQLKPSSDVTHHGGR